jgi:hypothetical protein
MSTPSFVDEESFQYEKTGPALMKRYNATLLFILLSILLTDCIRVIYYPKNSIVSYKFSTPAGTPAVSLNRFVSKLNGTFIAFSEEKRDFKFINYDSSKKAYTHLIDITIDSIFLLDPRLQEQKYRETSKEIDNPVISDGAIKTIAAVNLATFMIGGGLLILPVENGAVARAKMEANSFHPKLHVIIKFISDAGPSIIFNDYIESSSFEPIAPYAQLDLLLSNLDQVLRDRVSFLRLN